VVDRSAKFQKGPEGEVEKKKENKKPGGEKTLYTNSGRKVNLH